MRHPIRSAVVAAASAVLLASGTGTAAAQGSLELALPLFAAIPGLSSLAPAPAPDPAAQPDLLPAEVRAMAFEGSVVAAVNEARLVVGADRLVTVPELEASARERAAELAAGDTTTGDLPVPEETQTPSQDRTALTLPAGASPQNALSAMLSDTGMRERMLNGEFTEVGVGVATAPDGTVHVVQDFART